MLERSERRLTTEERADFHRALDSQGGKPSLGNSLFWFAVWSGTCLACFAGLMTLFALLDEPSGLWFIVIPIPVIVGILSFYAACIVVSSHFRFAGYSRHFIRETAPQMLAALSDGRASVLRVTSDNLIVVDGSDAFEGDMTYIYAIGDGTSLYLRGQDIGPEDRDATWPARSFEIVTTRAHGLWIGILACEGALEPSLTIPLEEMPEDYWWTSEPESESILSGEPEEVLRRLGYEPNQGRLDD